MRKHYCLMLSFTHLHRVLLFFSIIMKEYYFVIFRKKIPSCLCTLPDGKLVQRKDQVEDSSRLQRTQQWALLHAVFAVHCQDRRTNSCLAPLPPSMHDFVPFSRSSLCCLCTVAGAACFRCCRTDGSPFSFGGWSSRIRMFWFDLVWVFTLQLLAAIVPLRWITLQSYPCSWAYHRLQLVATEGRG